MSSYRHSYMNKEFLKEVEAGKLTPSPIAFPLHLHWILVRGRPHWVESRRQSKACGTARCRMVHLPQS